MIPQFSGVAALVSRRGGQTTSFKYLSRVPTFEHNFWVGYTTRPVSEEAGAGRFARQVYEYLGPTAAQALPAARHAGFCDAAELPPFHRQQLRIGQPMQ